MAASPAPVASPTPGAASSPAVPSAAAGDLDACELLTTAEVTGILGTATAQAKPMPGTGWVAGQCAWNGLGSGFFLSVGTAASIKAAVASAAADATAKLVQFKAAGSSPKDAAGIGDAAAVNPNGIAATSGDSYLEITNLGLTEDQLIEIAKLAVARL